MISVIIPTYNSSQFLEECIDSVLQQKECDFEVIIVNDGSTDKSTDILKRYEKSNDKILVINQHNSGVSVARNKGLERARGEYVLFLDSDDYLLGKYTLQQLQLSASDSQADLVLFKILFEGRKPKKSSEQILYKDSNLSRSLGKFILSEEINSPCNKLYRLDTINSKSIRFDPNLDIGEDLMFNLKYIKQCKSMLYTNNYLYHYRTSNENSATRKFNLNKFDQLMTVGVALHKLALEIGDAQLIQAVKFIRIKNTLSCIRDLPKSNYSWIKQKQLASNYKRENTPLVSRGIGVKFLTISIVYSLMSSVVILILFTTINKIKLKPKILKNLTR